MANKAHSAKKATTAKNQTTNNLTTMTINIIRCKNREKSVFSSLFFGISKKNLMFVPS